MQTYRIYLLTKGVRGKGTDAKCLSDKEARELAQRMLPSPTDKAEVWLGARMITLICAPTGSEIQERNRLWDRLT